MKQNYTDITIILDRSGSMRAIQSDTIGGVNRFIEDQRKAPGEATFALVQFDDQYEPGPVALIQDAKLLTIETYQPRGWTALYGAIGRTVADIGNRLKALPEDQRPEKVVVVIVTDGEENSSFKYEWSRDHTAVSVRDAIKSQSEIYKWQFVYIGANQDAILNAAKLGIASGNALNYTANAAGTSKLYDGVSNNLTKLRSCASKDMGFSDAQRQDQLNAKP